MESKLPKIMYDQDQFSPVYWFNDSWISFYSYKEVERISGYAPQGWILYSQAEPESFFFGAYPTETLKKEAETGLKNIMDNEFITFLNSIFSQMHKKTKEVSRRYFKEFYKKEKEFILNNPQEVVSLINEIRNAVSFCMPCYILTQPQRFYEVEKIINEKNNPELKILSETSHTLTDLMLLKKQIAHIAKRIKESNLVLDEFFEKNTSELATLGKTLEDLSLVRWNLFEEKIFDMDEVKSEIQYFLNNENKLDGELQTIKDVERNIVERRKVDMKDEYYFMADAIGKFTLYRYNTNSYIPHLVNIIKKFGEALQELYGLQEKEFDAYNLQEILDLIEKGKKVEKELIDRRKKGYLAIYNSEGMSEYFGDEAREIVRELLEYRQKVKKEIKKTKGNVASFPLGISKLIEGEVFVLRSAINIEKNIADFKEGHIFIATQTHPAVVPIMQKAKAIVTDEGGITCHAAIVSREIGKPCIVGSEIATQIFKTGDRARLNLETGEIEKIF